MLRKKESGFTLIELLVVIAIIGLLAAVVLASVGSARVKGVDSTIKTQMSGLRAAAELYASNNGNSYLGVCGAASSAATPGINTMLASARDAKSTTNTLRTASNFGLAGQTVELATEVVCADDATGWIAQAPLGTTGTYWCADSTGSSKTEGSALPQAQKTCA